VTSGLGDLHAGGNPVLRCPDGLAALGRPCLTPAGRPIRGDPARRPPEVLRRRRPFLASILSLALSPSTRYPALREEGKNHTRPRRRRPEQLRVTLTLCAGQLIRQPPAPGRVQTLHQRPGTISSDPTTLGGST
jgi:hypothetical protein